MPFGKQETLSDDQVEELEDMFRLIDSNMEKINEWEKGFIEDNRHRLEQYGKRTYLTTKQWETIYKIYKKVEDA